MLAYQTHYIDLGFERSGLFKIILKYYRCTDVLYPGCSIHTTPSLFFPHVVDVDQSEEAARFFARKQSILDYINRHKNYKRSVHLRFIQQDYLESLPLREGTFDLLLALFAGGISRSCRKYVKKGGLIVSNNHQNDAGEAAGEDDLILISTIQLKGGQYVSVEEGMDTIEIPVQTSRKNALRQRGGSVEYIDHETYYVFERRF